jgi:predicted membrane protein
LGFFCIFHIFLLFFLLYRFRFISLDFVSYFTDFVGFRFLTLQISLDFVFVSFTIQLGFLLYFPYLFTIQLRGTYKVRNEIETKRNQRKRNEMKRNETKSTKTKRNEIKEMKTK